MQRWRKSKDGRLSTTVLAAQFFAGPEIDLVLDQAIGVVKLLQKVLIALEQKENVGDRSTMSGNAATRP